MIGFTVNDAYSCKEEVSLACRSKSKLLRGPPGESLLTKVLQCASGESCALVVHRRQKDSLQVEAVKSYWKERSLLSNHFEAGCYNAIDRALHEHIST